MVIVALVVLFVLFGLPLIFQPTLWGSSESREVHVAWSLLHGGDWILPLRNGIVPSKPPLFHWTTALISLVFGDVSPGTTRLVSLLAAGGVMFWTLSAVSAIAKRWGVSHDRERIFLAAVIVVTSYLFSANALDAKVDMFFTFWITGAFYYFLQYRVLKEKTHTRAFWYLWLGCAMASLTKGPLGFVLGGLFASSAVIWVFGVREAIGDIKRHLVPFLVSVALLASWYYLAFSRGGDAIVERQLYFENIKRLFGGDDINTEVFWFYLPSFIRTMFPWSILFFLGVWSLIRGSRPASMHKRVESVGFFIASLGLLFFSIPSGKRHSYLLPLLPWIVVALSFYLDPKRILSFVDRWCPIFLFCSTTIFFVFLEFFLPHLRYSSVVRLEAIYRWYQHDGFVLLALLGFAWLVSMISLTQHAQRSRSIAILFALYFPMVCGSVGLSIKGALKGFAENAQQIGATIGEYPLTVVKNTRDEYFDPILFYLHRPVRIVTAFEHCDGYYLFKRELFDTVREKERFEIVRLYQEVQDSSKENAKNEIVLASCK